MPNNTIYPGISENPYKFLSGNRHIGLLGHLKFLHLAMAFMRKRSRLTPANVPIGKASKNSLMSYDIHRPSQFQKLRCLPIRVHGHCWVVPMILDNNLLQ